MDEHDEDLSPSISDISIIDLPMVIEQSPSHESKSLRHSVLNFEEKLQAFRTRMHGHVSTSEHNPVVEPVKPMRYVRHFNVSVSLKKSRLLRFFIFK